MKKRIFSYSIFILDILILVFSFMFTAWTKPATYRVIEIYLLRFLIFLAFWLSVSFLFKKYSIRHKTDRNQLVFSIVRINIYITFIVFCIIFLFRFQFPSRLLVFGTIFIASVLEIILFSALYYAFKFQVENPSFAKTTFVTKSKKLDIFNAKETSLLTEPTQKYFIPGIEKVFPKHSILIKLREKYLAGQSKLFSFINDNLELLKFSSSSALIIDTDNYIDIASLKQNSQQLFINLHKANDFRRLNKYFIKISESMQINGVVIFKAETLTQRYSKFLAKFGKILGKVLYFIDFLFYRISPKLPIMQGVYFFLTKGRNRALSKTEVLGRLYYCGFEIINIRDIDGYMCVIMKKTKAPSVDPSPSYGPLIKLKRFGKNGKAINVYKFRTMHPYSEYLHSYMVEKVGFGEKGKVDDDFRVTSWGKALRKVWLDEIPQFYNLFKGDLSLIGVRPVSERFLKEYPEDLKLLRSKYKPGCLPPYVAYKKQKVEEYIESERKYFLEKEKHPFLTDVKIMFMAVYNILTGKIKSE